MSLIKQQRFWRTALYTGAGLTILIVGFGLWVPDTSLMKWLVSGVAGWGLLLLGITMFISLLLFLRNRRGEAAGMLAGILFALVFLLIVGIAVGVAAMF